MVTILEYYGVDCGNVVAKRYNRTVAAESPYYALGGMRPEKFKEKKSSWAEFKKL